MSVIVVDDEPGFRETAVRMLTRSGLEVVGECGTTAEALRIAQELRPQAALVDFSLPDGDGIALAGALAVLAWRPRVVVISTDPEVTTDADVRAAGAVAFIAKEDLSSDRLRSLLTGADA
jgi:DNA-binding NarL/FixJ family response regulator